MRKLILILGLLSITASALAGGGGCDGPCPESPARLKMYVCEIISINQIGMIENGDHRTFKDAQLVDERFVLKNKFILWGDNQQINYVSANFESNNFKPKLDFERSSVSPENTKYYFLLNWGSYAIDYPLIEKAYFDFIIKGNQMDFSVSFQHSQDIAGTQIKIINTKTGKMNCI